MQLAPAARQRLALISKQTSKNYTTATTATMTEPSKYRFNHSMIRVKDPKESVKFYEHLGMTMIKKLEMPDAKFDNYFMAYGA